MSPRTSKALAAWQELNDRQQGTLAAIYALDQAIEESRRHDRARGRWDNTPASTWRQIDFAHDPADRRLVGSTELQDQLARHGWDNQGNGSTMAALASRQLITRDQRPTALGCMHTIALTRDGRAAARAGTSLTPDGAPKAALGRRSWEVLALLWDADQRGEQLRWGYSVTVENVLIAKHVPPLAEPSGAGYAITDRGRDFYRQHHAAHTAAHPDVHAPHPDGAAAEPWPARADDILALHQQFYAALSTAWSNAYDMRQAADAEASSPAPAAVATLPAVVAEQTAARHRLWRDTAQQRAQLAAEHADDLHQRSVRAARAYAAAALAAFTAAVAGADPLPALRPPAQAGTSAEDDGWDEPRLPPPSATGIHAIDAEARKLHAAAVGAPLRRRGPAPTHRRRRYPPPSERPPRPGAALAALAKFLHHHVRDGALRRRVHGG